MRGLLRKTCIEVRWPVVLFGIGLALVMSLLTALLPKVLSDIDRIFDKLPFVKPLLTALLGVDPGHGFTAQMMQAFLWVHPTVLSLIWAHALMYCTRVPAAEIDRGSIDFLLGLPISRWKLHTAELIGFAATGIVILSIGYTGHWLASASLQPGMRPSAYATFCVLSNLFAVYLAVGGFTFLVSSASDRRGRAIGVMFAVLLLSFLLNFVAQFWEAVKSFSFLSIMEYYRPAQTIQAGEFPWQDVMILLAVAATSWTAGGIILRRRNICTV
ncbi:ABC transporter permease subunit [Fuerstiella marisgermanici]|uniref:ABC-type transport system involved in multi-copper enzyme maturation, permease component n=1 Tax=Fuerstiella marisgermanici TaxID=1891926 RepID=A0A1P8WS27_9PLAN|nr:ABC transporter permease subunit [Fuerstiella marisgermanici]APZ96851.1 ABC-type transport system involved in multi-copper enzyme maturation, permease component [Fuerstiella marisgermanici]